MHRRRLFGWILAGLLVLGVGGLLGSRWLGWQLLNAEIRHKFPGVPRLDPPGLAAWLRDPHRPPPVLLDVREPAEYQVSHLAGARRVEPGSDPVALGLLHDQPIVTYCSVGYRSAQFARKLRQAGFTNVRNLEGSIFAWANEGRPVVRDGRLVERVHPYNKVWGFLLQPAHRAPVPPADQHG